MEFQYPFKDVDIFLAGMAHQLAIFLDIFRKYVADDRRDAFVQQLCSDIEVVAARHFDRAPFSGSRDASPGSTIQSGRFLRGRTDKLGHIDLKALTDPKQLRERQ